MGHVTYFSNFGTPAISREWVKLETSNMARILITRGTNEQNAKLGQRDKKGSRDLVLKFWDPLHISGTGEARNFKFGMHIGHERHQQKIFLKKLGQRGSERCHVTYFLNFGTGPHLGNE